MEKMSKAQEYFDQADVFLVAINSDGIVTDINEAGCRILGHVRSEIVGKDWFNSFVPKEKREETRQLFRRTLQGSLRHVHYQHPIIVKRGRQRVFDWHNALVSDRNGKSIGTLSSGVDITESIKGEPIDQVENLLEISLDNMIEGYQIIDRDWRYAYVNEAVVKQGRSTKEALLGKTMMQAYPGIEQTQLFNHLRNCMANRVPHKMETEFAFPDGSKGWFELHIEPVPQGILILSLDVTKNKENEVELNKYKTRLENVVAERTSELVKANEKLTFEMHERQKTFEGLKLRATILDNAREAIFLINTNGGFAYANEAASKIYGFTLEEFLRLNIRELLPPEEAFKVEGRLKNALEKGQYQFETIHLRKDKTQMKVQIRHSLIKTQHGQFIVTVVRDITK